MMYTIYSKSKRKGEKQMKNILKLTKDILETIIYIIIGTAPITIPFLSCCLLGVLVNL